MRILSLALLLFAAACVATTTNQRFYELVSNYAVVQTVAISYKDQCEKGRLPDNCKDVVKDIKKIDSKANAVIQAAQSNTDKPNYIAASYTALTSLKDDMTSLLRGL